MPCFKVPVGKRERHPWQANLAPLRASPEAAKRYEAVKLKAVQAGASLLHYSEAKSALVEALLLRALAWQTDTSHGVGAEQ
ncbi:hypothetical protein AVDCRST_MAG94-4660 [uncultured Leptolyngbya sp.]|uniref:Uncharacterized protein n=1 Tax=uncultured Leptolyngbya sp. TaxID=332963 RepID=A0A6J4NAR8_9CYAN|nr:hypothetical protein AVDCRST_MAG94-4660 [uncultured Leptolyngbya sp.]